MNESILEEKAGLMSHAVKTEVSQERALASDARRRRIRPTLTKVKVNSYYQYV